MTYVRKSIGQWKSYAFMALCLCLTMSLFYACHDEEEALKINSADEISSTNRSGTSLLNASVSYDVVIERSASFANGVTSSSPAWKKLAILPETESYTYDLDIVNGQTSLVQDNIVLSSHKVSQADPAIVPRKFEYVNGVATRYNAAGNVISSSNIGLSMMVDSPFDFAQYGQPIDTVDLNAQGANYWISNGVVILSKRIANGDSENSITRIVQANGAVLSQTRYDDTDPTKVVFRASHTYDVLGNPITSVLTYKDYYPDGDIKTAVELVNYSNFSITL